MVNSDLAATRLSGKQVLYGTTNVTTDANGAGWIPFTPNFKDANTLFLVGQTDINIVDRVVHTLSNNGSAVILFKGGITVKNANGWITWIAIGTPK